MNQYLLSCEYNKENILSNISEVTIMINVTSNIKILSDYFFQKYNHCEIYLNDSLFYSGKDKNYFNSNS